MAKKTGATRLAELAGAPPRMATVDDLEAAGPSTGRTHANMTKSRKPGRINLKAVAEALAEEGLDPTTEMIRILKAEVPVLDINGKPRVDPKTKKPMMRPAVDDDTKLRTLNELLQYTQPKLKSVEMKVSGALDLTSEQLDNRITLLLSKATK
jgi:hypothetical protein